MNRDNARPKVKGKMPGKNTVEYVKKHMEHAANATYLKKIVRDGDKWAKGPFFTDAEGNVLIDFVCHVGALPLGYKHPAIMKLKRKLWKYDPDRYAGTDFILKADVPTSTDLHAKIHSITSHLGMDTHFFSNSGAEAVENAIKICYDFKRNNGFGIGFDGAFHGRTLGALSFNRSKTVQRKYYPKIPSEHLPYCDCAIYTCGCGWKDREGKNSLEKLLSINDPDEIAFILIEPMQGEGGYKVPNKSFIQEIYSTAQGLGIPVISDEIQAGFGRTGKWWAVEHFGLIPDVITSAKALGVGATISRREMFPDENGRISSTWGEGNLTASALGYTTIEVIEKEGLLDNATGRGHYLRDELRKLVSDHHPKINGVRGMGLMDAVDIFNVEMRDRFIDGCLGRGLVLIGCGYNSVRFLPPLDIRQREIDISIEIMDDVLKGLKY